jgi:hypothetical protein
MVDNLVGALKTHDQQSACKGVSSLTGYSLSCEIDKIVQKAQRRIKEHKEQLNPSEDFLFRSPEKDSRTDQLRKEQCVSPANKDNIATPCKLTSRLASAQLHTPPPSPSDFQPAQLSTPPLRHVENDAGSTVYHKHLQSIKGKGATVLNTPAKNRCAPPTSPWVEDKQSGRERSGSINSNGQSASQKGDSLSLDAPVIKLLLDNWTTEPGHTCTD